MLSPGFGLSHPEQIQEQGRQIRQQAILWRVVAAEMRGDSYQLCLQAQHLTTVSRHVLQRIGALLSVLQQM
jgi:hypothetical protein